MKKTLFSLKYYIRSHIWPQSKSGLCTSNLRREIVDNLTDEYLENVKQEIVDAINLLSK